jgi:outer membrane immunogenic protein
MQKFAVAIAAMATLTGASAFAADMAVKVPPLPPLAAPNWTGFYIGGALGGKLGQHYLDDNFNLGLTRHYC